MHHKKVPGWHRGAYRHRPFLRSGRRAYFRHVNCGLYGNRNLFPEGNRNTEEEGSLGSILGPSAEERDGPGGDAYLKLILLKISKDFHTIKGCLLVLTAISVIGIILGLLSFLF